MEKLLQYLNAHPEVKNVYFNKEKTNWQFHQHKDNKENKDKEERYPVKMDRAKAIKFCEGKAE